VGGYTLGDAARICGISRRRLRYWERTALLESSSLESDEQTAFDFRGLVSVRSIVGLLQDGVPLQRIRTHMSEVRACMPELDALPALHVWGVRRHVVVRHDGQWMETSGQLLLDFALPEGGGVERLEDHEPESRTRRMAESWFERGCELDTERATYEEAAEAYRQAIEIAPDFADAHCNLGSVYFNQDAREKAKACFRQAIELDPGHVEANLNLGAIREEDGADESALRHYRSALETDPLYADVHVSLALVYEKLTLVRTARAHWRRYLQLDPTGAWAELARRRIAER
jgi:tetratricopeptide (TPR) repeat protein